MKRANHNNKNAMHTFRYAKYKRYHNLDNCI